MLILYRFMQFVSLWLLVMGMQCTLPVSNQAISDESNDKHLPDFAQDTILINTYYKLASNYLFKDANKSMKYSKQVLQLAQKHQWDKGKILAYNILSSYYLQDGSYDVLRELSNETLTLSQKLNLPLYSGHAKRFMAESYSEYRQWDSARLNYRQAIKIFTDAGADSARAICLEDLGNSYRENGNYDEAFKLYKMSYALFNKINSKSGKASVFQSEGYVYVRKSEHKKSEPYYLKALDLYRSDLNFYGELSILNDLGNTYYWMGQYDKSIEVCLRALEYSGRYNSFQQTNWAHQTLSRSYRAQDKLKEALVHADKYYFNRRMLHDNYIRRQYTMYQLMYDNQQMGTAIQRKVIDEQSRIQQFLIGFTVLIIAFAAFLWLNNKKLRRKNAEIKEALIQGQAIERKRVAAELHDHLGGTLASLNWYLYGIDKNALSAQEQKIYSSVHQMVGAAYKEVRSLSHNLMPAELEEHGLIVALRRLVSKLNENKDIEFAFDSNGRDKRYKNKVEFELYSIVLELTNNIIKHSGATKAYVSLNEDYKNILLTVRDNGIGVNKTSKHGTGLINVKNRIESLSGKLNIQDNAENGTCILLQVPKMVH